MFRPVGERSSNPPWIQQAEWTQRVGAFTELSKLVRELGADPVSLFVDAGLDPHDLDDPEGRISYAAIAWALEEGARRTACPHIGLLAGQMWQLSDLGLVGELTANSGSVRDALKKLTVHQRAN